MYGEWPGCQLNRNATVVHLDSKLNFNKHCNEINAKMVTQVYRTTASTLGATLLKARQLYVAIIRPALTYGGTLWHGPNDQSRRLARKLQRQQNFCLRVVLRAFRKTTIRQLHTESHVPPLHLWLNGKVAIFQHAIEKRGIKDQIRQSCYNIQLRIRLSTCECAAQPLMLHMTPGRKEE